jgi:hypothetical protein
MPLACACTLEAASCSAAGHMWDNAVCRSAQGEQHGFRGSGAIRRALDGELYFYGRVLGFEASMPDGLEPPEVVNVK